MIFQELFPEPASDPVHFAFECNKLKEMGNSELAVWARELNSSLGRCTSPPPLLSSSNECR